MKTINSKILFLLGIVILLFLPIQECYADNFHTNIMNEIGENFLTSAKSWASVLEGYAKNLFFLLLSISLAWTTIELALKHAEFGEIIAELTKFILFAGIFLWLITNGADFAFKIFSTFSRIGSSLSGFPIGPNDITPAGPSDIIDLGIDFYVNIFNKANFSMTNIGTNLISLISLIIGLIFFFFTLVISVKLLVQIIILWCYMYAGIFFLGFGGSKWTREYVLNYFKGVLAHSTQYFAMLIIVAMMKSLLSNFTTYINDASDPIQLLQLLVCPIIFYFLMEKLPPALSGIVSGKFEFHSGPSVSSIAGAGVGATFGAASAPMIAASMGKDFVSGVANGIKDSNSINSNRNNSQEHKNDEAANSPSKSTNEKTITPKSTAQKLGEFTGMAGKLTGKSALKAVASSIKGGATATGFMKQSLKDPTGAVKSTLQGTGKVAMSVVSTPAKAAVNALKFTGESIKNTADTLKESYEKGKNAAIPDSPKTNEGQNATSVKENQTQQNNNSLDTNSKTDTQKSDSKDKSNSDNDSSAETKLENKEEPKNKE